MKVSNVYPIPSPAVFFTLSALISGLIALLVWRKRTATGAIPLAALMAELGRWAGAYATMWASSSLGFTSSGCGSGYPKSINVAMARKELQ